MSEGRNLRIPRTAPIGVGEAQAQTTRQEWSTADTVEDSLRAKHVNVGGDQPPPDDCPKLTTDMLTTQDSREYTRHYVNFLSWFEYTGELLAHTQARILQSENILDILTAQMRKQARDLSEGAGAKKPSVEELKDRILNNPEYQAELRELQKLQQARYHYEKKVEALERGLRIISRQVEIKKLDFEQSRTGSNMPGRGKLRDPFTGG